MDRAIVDGFAAAIDDALAGGLDGWAETPRGRVALVVVLDQFTRSRFRDSARAFAGDPAAQRLAAEGFNRGDDQALGLAERNFLLMPFMHAEDLALQERGMREIARVVADAPPALQPIYQMGIEQSGKYHDVIARFGRFPHRNAALGRTSTDEELEFLRDWHERQRPSGARTL